MIAFWGWVLTPELRTEVPAFDPERVAMAESLRDVRVDTTNPITVFREVDYSEGSTAAWWPRHESPC
ncbi:MAG: hypothetical protein LR015_05100 [Verrucomicrobia bacterium]|nr:hypothetical protein [Verrucomicrobiota bacterium]